MLHQPDNSPYMTCLTNFWPKCIRFWTFYMYSLKPHSIPYLTDWTYYWPKSIRHWSLYDAQWCLLMSHQPYRSPYLDDWTFSDPRVLQFELSIQTHWLLLILFQPYRSPNLIYWTYFWPKSPQIWTFYSDKLPPFWFYFSHTEVHIWSAYFFSVPTFLDRELSIHTHCLTTSDIQYCILDLRDIFLAKEYSILNFSYITIDSFWWYFSHRVLHIWPKWHISGQGVLDLELLIHYCSLLLMLHHPYR